MTNKKNNKKSKRIARFVSNIKSSKAIISICLFCRTLFRVAEILVPAGLGLYLLLTNTDRIVVIIAGFMVAFAIVKLVQLAYTAESKLQ